MSRDEKAGAEQDSGRHEHRRRVVRNQRNQAKLGFQEEQYERGQKIRL
jgi:hypothetical protein